jgi:hypothetical protein
VAIGVADLQQYETNTDTTQPRVTLNTNYKSKTNETVSSVQWLFQYCQLPDKNSRDISDRYLETF